ncbi:uncharacterized protein JCM15063_006567 [Sporobolomyces koalae]|uniref:uncharacterized protein n=1 Tax=Sporobolomyces koalae TaxID=500713 RepID=UPI00317614E1
MWIWIWSLSWIVIQCLRTRLERPGTVDISPWSVHWSTRSRAPHRLVQHLVELIPHKARHSRTETVRRLASYWDFGTIVVLGGFVLGQIVLVVALWKALVALSDSFQTATTESLYRLAKRAPIPNPRDELLLQPFIPGITTSLSIVPLFLTALVASQVYHEFGHALCAASESIEIESIGVYWVLLILPTFYVSLLPTKTTSSSSSPSGRRTTRSESPYTTLRIASAGIWYNCHLVFVAYLCMSRDRGGRGWSDSIVHSWGMDKLDQGVRILHDPTSSLATVLPSPSRKLVRITHVNDLELESFQLGPQRVINDYLSDRTTTRQDDYSNLGWCLPFELMSTDPLECCASPSPHTNTIPTHPNHDLCFKSIMPNDARSTCLEYERLATVSDDPRLTRCVNQASCQTDHLCVKLADDVVRLRIVDDGLGSDRGEQVVIWKGSREDLKRILKVTEFVPKFWFVPATLDETLSRFFSALFTLSLTVGFLNVLPLPFLDGTVIVSSVLDCVARARPPNHEYSLPTTTPFEQEWEGGRPKSRH